MEGNKIKSIKKNMEEDKKNNLNNDGLEEFDVKEFIDEKFINENELNDKRFSKILVTNFNLEKGERLMEIIKNLDIEGKKGKISKLLDSIKYAVVCREICPETERAHEHAYIIFRESRSFKTIKKLFPKRNIKIMTLKSHYGIDYVKKHGDFEEIGDEPQQGARTDLKLLKKMVKDGVKTSKIVMECETFNQIRMVEKFKEYSKKEVRDHKTPNRVIWCWGNNKNSLNMEVYELFNLSGNKDNVFITVKNAGSMCFTGYEDEKTVFIKNFDKEDIATNILGEIMSPFPFKMNVKFGVKEILAKTIIITSDINPFVMYREDRHKRRVLDEITELFFYDGKEMINRELKDPMEIKK